ncbi:MAG TPA: hypothetical protein VEU11_18385 [Terriglobales bacterium]|jgi:hypothetical protein|nr:hypothetical protein [Terriglobales bacterium]
MNPQKMKLLAVVFSVVLACMVFLPAAAADDWNQATKMHFSEPVAIPGMTLPAGTYWFLLADTQGGQQMVQVFNADRSKLYATAEVVPTERRHSTNEVELQFAERSPQRPEALLKWYYPGRLTGQEFLYPQKWENRFMREAKQDVVASPFNSSATFPTPGT